MGKDFFWGGGGRGDVEPGRGARDSGSRSVAGPCTSPGSQATATTDSRCEEEALAGD